MCTILILWQFEEICYNGIMMSTAALNIWPRFFFYFFFFFFYLFLSMFYGSAFLYLRNIKLSLLLPFSNQQLWGICLNANVLQSIHSLKLQNKVGKRSESEELEEGLARARAAIGAVASKGTRNVSASPSIGAVDIYRNAAAFHQ